MPRGNAKPLGSEFMNKNGYTYVKCSTGWQPKAKVVLEEKLGRPLEDTESAVFLDGDRRNLDPSNIGCKVIANRPTGRARLAAVEYMIGETKAKLEELEQEATKLRTEIADARNG